ncbi:MAG: hypothetical protein AAF089_03680 [Bacteroidota bacterium]
MLRLATACILALLLSLPTQAQEVGTCEPGLAERVLDVAGAKAKLHNTGNLFWNANLGFSDFTYAVPKNAGTDANVYVHALWIAGLVEGDTLGAGAPWRGYEYWPGPIPESGVPSDCAAFDQLWSVRRSDLARFYESGEATEDLRTWPAHLGAPVIDGDGIPGNYDLDAGDQPALRGDQTVWWVMNDAGNVHRVTRSAPLGLDVRVEAFAKASTVQDIHEATFYRYTLTNRSTSTTDRAFVGFFSEMTGGYNYQNDFVGTDTTLSLWYTYDFRPDIYVGGSWAIGATVLEGPIILPDGRDNDRDGAIDEPSERGDLHATLLLYGGGGDPTHDEISSAQDIYHYLSGSWRDGVPLTEGGYGYNGPDGGLGQSSEGSITRYIFSGEPGSFWSEPCFQPGCEEPSNDGRRHGVYSAGPFRLEPGESQTISIAIVHADGDDYLSAVHALKDATRYVRTAFDLGLLDPEPVPIPADFLAEDLPGALGLGTPFPNPTTDSITLPYRVPATLSGPIRVALTDVLGREVAVVVEGTPEPGEYEVVLDTRVLAPGVYVVRMQRALALSEVQRFTVVR